MYFTVGTICGGRGDVHAEREKIRVVDNLC